MNTTYINMKKRSYERKIANFKKSCKRFFKYASQDLLRIAVYAVIALLVAVMACIIVSLPEIIVSLFY